MLKHDGATFYGVTVSLGMNRVALANLLQSSPELRNTPVSFELDHPFIRNLKLLANSSKDLGLELAAMSLNRVISEIEAMPCRITWDQYENRLQEIESRIMDGLTLTHFLALDTIEANLFEQKEPLVSPDFPGKFGAAAYEVSEAAKCLALGRSTASVFHSIRSLEAAITALSRCLQIPDPTKPHERSWKKMLDALDTGIKLKWPSNAQRMNGDGQFFDAAYAALAAMQNPWRNATMHLDQKYTPDEAKIIFESVCGFMRRISMRMDETGQPIA